MLKYKTDHYYSYAEVTDFLKKAKKEFPRYFKFESIGKTSEGRAIWMATLTDFEIAKAESKPGFWIDANTHASEITGSQCALYFIYKLLTTADLPESRFLLENISFYIVPRLSADGAEYYLKNRVEVRSTPINWPEKSESYFSVKDIDGNGEALMIRKKDPAGAFKVSKTNSKIMVQRQPHEVNYSPSENQNQFYKLYEEGEFRNYDGFHEGDTAEFGFDLNRQFPIHFRPEGQQMGAGPYPMYLPEAKAVVETLSSKKRIFGHISLHTYGGVILRPPACKPDEDYDAQDIEMYKSVQKELSAVSGYKGLSVYKDFRYLPREFISGSLDEWSFDQRGVMAFTIEVWDLWKKAGIDVQDDVSRYFHPKEDELLKIFSWAKENLKYEHFYQDWKPFLHPQLGEVEIGGWKKNFLFRNPPPKLLQQEVEKVFKIITTQAKILPIVRIKNVTVEKIENDLKKLKVVVENQGFLPTHLSQQALKQKAVEHPHFELNPTKGIKILHGKSNGPIPHLNGRSRFIPWHSPVNFVSRRNDNEIVMEWTLNGSGIIEFYGDFSKGGVLIQKIKI